MPSARVPSAMAHLLLQLPLVENKLNSAWESSCLIFANIISSSTKASILAPKSKQAAISGSVKSDTMPLPLQRFLGVLLPKL